MADRLRMITRLFQRQRPPPKPPPTTITPSPSLLPHYSRHLAPLLHSYDPAYSTYKLLPSSNDSYSYDSGGINHSTALPHLQRIISGGIAPRPSGIPDMRSLYLYPEIRVSANCLCTGWIVVPFVYHFAIGTSLRQQFPTPGFQFFEPGVPKPNLIIPELISAFNPHVVRYLC